MSLAIITSYANDREPGSHTSIKQKVKLFEATSTTRRTSADTQRSRTTWGAAAVCPSKPCRQCSSHAATHNKKTGFDVEPGTCGKNKK